MASGSETIYIKADRNIEVTKPDVTLGDVLKISCVNPVSYTHLDVYKRQILKSFLNLQRNIHLIIPENLCGGWAILLKNAR